MTRQQTLDGINAGPTIVNYAGHGSVDLWRANVLTSQDAATLGNSHLSVFTIATCLNGYFADPFLPCLGRALMSAPNGGAVAVIASSGINQANGQQELCRAYYAQQFNGRQATIGEALLRAKQATAAGDTRRTVILLGDPLTRLR